MQMILVTRINGTLSEMNATAFVAMTSLKADIDYILITAAILMIVAGSKLNLYLPPFQNFKVTYTNIQTVDSKC